LFNNAKGIVGLAEILPEHRYHKEGAAVVRELLQKESISRDRFYHLAGVDTGKMFLEKANVFAFHYDSQEVTFQSALMKRYFEENSADWKRG
jgi:hypothetical protein